MVSLSAGQQRVLDYIETDLEDCEPGLRSMFAIFTRLTRDDGAPRTESLRPGAYRLRRTSAAGGPMGTARAVIAIPLVLGVLALFVFLAVGNSATHGCRPGTGPHAGVARTASCQAAQLPAGRS